MCSLELYNWYENRFPDQFEQLIKIKHYNISELSFLLSKVWYRLDYGEKLLMCAVYNDDFNLARQMLNENIMFRVNPFLSKRYMSTSYFERKARFSSSTSINQIGDESSNVNVNSENNDQTCWCYNADTQSLFKYRPSVSSIQDWLISASNDEEFNNSLNSSSQDDTGIKLNISSSSSPALSYFFNQRLQENQIYSPFYLAIKLNKLKMCQMFVDYMKQAYYSHFSALHRIQSKHNTGMPMYYLHHTKCGLKTQGFAARFPPRIYLSHFLDEPELVNLFVATLMNRNYDLAMLILNNCEKPKLVLNFYNLSESFIKSKEFCLYLARARLVEPNVLLKVATNRHQCQTTCHLLDYFESIMSIDKSVSVVDQPSGAKSLCDLYKIVLFNSISIGDFPIFTMILERITKNLPTEYQEFLFSQITIDGILRKKYTPGNSRLARNIKRSRSTIDPEAVKSLALSKNFDFDAFMDTHQDNQTSIHLPTLTYVNRLKMVKFLFSSSNDQVSTQSGAESIDSLKKSLNDWSQLEVYLDKKLDHYRECFETKSYYMNEYYIIDDSEPYIIKKFIETKEYKVTQTDLISVAHSSLSELTFYYLLAGLDFENAQNWPLLVAGDDHCGNFVEILFCRLVRGSNANPEQEIRLRRLFFEMIILNNAKLSCSLNMLSLFMTQNQFTKQRLIEFYFPALFYLAKSVNLFPSDVYKNRFELLTSWLFQSTIQVELASCGLLNAGPMSKEQIELVISQYYSYLPPSLIPDTSDNKSQQVVTKFRVNLREMSRDVFMRSYLTRGKPSEDKLLNLISESTRRFIFYMNEIKNLF